MDELIDIGNDELILHIRKNHACPLSNAELGKRIWQWVRDEAHGDKLAEDVPCLWGDIRATGLPITAARLRLPIERLPDLYRLLDRLGTGQA